jgi:calcium-translocating P-type ATPase, PMCA-type
MKYYLEDVKDVLKELDSNEDGLSNIEVNKRLVDNGKNRIEEGKKDGIFKKIFNSLKDPMIIMLLVTAVISAILAKIQNEPFTDVFIILFVVIINTIMGLIQEGKAEKAIDSLKKMTAATSKVIRDGKIIVIKSEDLVKGDVIVLEAGDLVPADCRLIEAYSMKTDESTLTGESVPVNKLIDILNMSSGENNLIPLADRTNMVYSGSTVAYGRGKAVITEVAMNTEIGKIATSLQTAKKEVTQLQKKMTQLSKTLTKIVLIICALVFVLRLIRGGGINADNFIDTTLMAVALAVAAIPEGLPAVVTVILSIGVTEMSKRKALIRKLNTVETIGCVQVICSDKTGTLTKNKMTVVESFVGEDGNKDDIDLLSKGMALCSDSKMNKEKGVAEGEPTENGLVEYAFKLGFNKTELEKVLPRVQEVPFDSMRKMMSTVHEVKAVDDKYFDKKYVQFTKGACEILLDRCDFYLENGKVKNINDNFKKNIFAKNKDFADRALRVLGCAYKTSDVLNYEASSEKVEKGLIFIGFVGMIDPCRDEVFDAIDRCKSAGIRPIMITGDHIDTAVAIAKQLKIIEDAKNARTGAEIDGITEEELIEVVKNVSVFARVQPEHKTRIVKALQKLNYITAMTGDGVNDAPSIKQANVGVAMGITGTDVTKGASDIIIADDNFATIVNAVEEGRKNYDNIRKIIQFQLSTNMAEVLVIFISSLLGITFLTPAHLLWINMITDSTPGLALGTEKAEGNIMKRKPRKTDDSVFADGAGFDMIWQGIVMAILVTISFFMGEFLENGRFLLAESRHGMSMAFLTMNFVEMFHAVCMRSQRKSIFKLNNFNWWLLGAIVLTIIFTIGVIYIPFFVNLFGFESINFTEFMVAFSLAFAIIPIIEIVKFFERKFSKA